MLNGVVAGWGLKSGACWLVVFGSIVERGLLDDVLRSGEDELGWMGEVGPFVGKNFFDEEFLFQVFEGLGGEGLNVETADFLWEFDDGGVVSVLELLKELAEASSECLQRFCGVITFNAGEFVEVG